MRALYTQTESTINRVAPLDYKYRNRRLNRSYDAPWEHPNARRHMREDYHVCDVSVSVCARVSGRVYVDMCDSANVSLLRVRVDYRHCCKLHGVLMQRKRISDALLESFRHLFIRIHIAKQLSLFIGTDINNSCTHLIAQIV